MTNKTASWIDFFSALLEDFIEVVVVKDCMMVLVVCSGGLFEGVTFRELSQHFSRSEIQYPANSKHKFQV